MDLVNKFFESIENKDDMKESVYKRGFVWQDDGSTSRNIFGLVKQIKAYTADMDRDEAIEKAVYATADFVKDGNL